MNRKLTSVGRSLVAGMVLTTGTFIGTIAASNHSQGQFDGGLGGSVGGGGLGSTGGFGNTGGFGSTGGFGNTGGMGSQGGIGNQGTGGVFGGAPMVGGNQTPSTYPGVFGGPGVSGENRLGNLNTRPLTAGSTANGMGATTSIFGLRTTPTGGGVGAGAGGGLGGGIGGGFGGLGGGMGLGGIGGLAGALGGRNRLGAMGGNGGNAQGKKAVRSIAVPDFEVKASSLPNVALQVQQRISKFPIPEKFRGVNAGYEEGEVVLRGVVATESDKRLMERLMKLEPGVDSIRNELVVQSNGAESVEARPNRQ